MLLINLSIWEREYLCLTSLQSMFIYRLECFFVLFLLAQAEHHRNNDYYRKREKVVPASRNHEKDHESIDNTKKSLIQFQTVKRLSGSHPIRDVPRDLSHAQILQM